MWAFDVDNLPETFQFISEILDEDKQKELTSLLDKVWFKAVISDVPQILQDWVLEDYAALYSERNDYDTSFKALKILQKEIFMSIDFTERFYYAVNEKDPNDDFRDFLADNGVTNKTEDLMHTDLAVLVDSAYVDLDYSENIIDDVMCALADEYALSYGRHMTDDQYNELRNMISSIVDEFRFNNNIKFMEEETMKANYQNTVNENNAIEDAMLALKTCLAGESDDVERNEIVEEFKNNYYNALAKDSHLARRSNRYKWARSLLCELSKQVTEMHVLIGNEEAEALIVREICNPVIESLKDAKTGDAPDSVKEILHEADNPEVEKRPNIIIRLTNKLKTFFGNLLKGIKKVFSAIKHAGVEVCVFFAEHDIIANLGFLAASCGVGAGIGKVIKKAIDKFGLTLTSATGVPTPIACLIYLAIVAVCTAGSFLFRKIFTKLFNKAVGAHNKELKEKLEKGEITQEEFDKKFCKHFWTMEEDSFDSDAAYEAAKTCNIID